MKQYEITKEILEQYDATTCRLALWILNELWHSRDGACTATMSGLATALNINRGRIQEHLAALTSLPYFNFTSPSPRALLTFSLPECDKCHIETEVPGSEPVKSECDKCNIVDNQAVTNECDKRHIEPPQPLPYNSLKQKALDRVSLLYNEFKHDRNALSSPALERGLKFLHDEFDVSLNIEKHYLNIKNQRNN